MCWRKAWFSNHPARRSRRGFKQSDSHRKKTHLAASSAAPNSVGFPPRKIRPSNRTTKRGNEDLRKRLISKHLPPMACRFTYLCVKEPIVVLFNDEVVADHPRQFRRDQIVYDPWHYLPVLVRKPGALRNGAPFKDWGLPAGLAEVRARLKQHADADRQFVKPNFHTLDFVQP